MVSISRSVDFLVRACVLMAAALSYRRMSSTTKPTHNRLDYLYHWRVSWSMSGLDFGGLSDPSPSLSIAGTYRILKGPLLSPSTTSTSTSVVCGDEVSASVVLLPSDSSWFIVSRPYFAGEQSQPTPWAVAMTLRNAGVCPGDILILESFTFPSVVPLSAMGMGNKELRVSSIWSSFVLSGETAWYLSGSRKISIKGFDKGTIRITR